MKHILNLLLILCPFIFFACQEDEEVAQSGGVGYLRLNVAASSEVTTKAYNAEQFQVIVTNTQTNEVAYQTEDASIPANEVTPIPLDAGTYKIEAKSYNYEGVEVVPGTDRPYYAGLTENVVITAGKSTDASVECKLANVKVTVNIPTEVVEAFSGRTISVSVKGGEYTPQNFTPETSGEKYSTYFPVVESLVATLSVSNPSNSAQPYTKEQTIDNVAGNTHYVLNYQLEETGNGDFTVTYDPTYNQYNFTVPVNPGAAISALLTASAWDRLAYLKAENVSSSSGAGELKFQYRAASSDESAAWTDVETAVSPTVENKYTAMLTGLTAETEYEYRLVDSNGTEIQKGTNFTTGAADARTELHNGSFELWTTGSSDGKETIYPGSADEAGNTTSFWNTSNPGTSQGLGAIGGAVNPTTGVTSPVKEGTYAAQLKSTNKLSVFAAASLYTGKFKGLSGMSANMEFGQPFTSRPIALHGYYQYTPQTMNHVDRMPDGVTLVEGETIDECSIFIALAKKSFTFNNSKEEEYIDYEGDDNIIAYGSLPSGAATSGDGYVEFTIPLKYKEANFGDQPTHIIIVCSASKYGDYMSGADNSTLYVDDFSLVYDGEPTIWDLSANN